MPRRSSPYGRPYKRERAALLAQAPTCALRLVCDGAPATEPDHDPPIALHDHVPGSGCCRLRPACGPCQRHQGGVLRVQGLEARGRVPAPSRRW